MAVRNDKLHHLIDKANDCLAFADKAGVAVYATQASEHAPEIDKAEDTVIIVLRGQKARQGRVAMTSLADLIRDSTGRW